METIDKLYNTIIKKECATSSCSNEISRLKEAIKMYNEKSFHYFIKNNKSYYKTCHYDKSGLKVFYYDVYNDRHYRFR